MVKIRVYPFDGRFFSFCFILPVSRCVYSSDTGNLTRVQRHNCSIFIPGLISFWSLTFPIAFLLEGTTDLGPKAYWVGLIVGIFRLWYYLKHSMHIVEKRTVQ